MFYDLHKFPINATSYTAISSPYKAEKCYSRLNYDKRNEFLANNFNLPQFSEVFGCEIRPQLITSYFKTFCNEVAVYEATI